MNIIVKNRIFKISLLILCFIGILWLGKILFFKPKEQESYTPIPSLYMDTKIKEIDKQKDGIDSSKQELIIQINNLEQDIEDLKRRLYTKQLKKDKFKNDSTILDEEVIKSKEYILQSLKDYNNLGTK